MGHREARGLAQGHVELDAESRLPGPKKQINTCQSWVSNRRYKMMGGSIKMGRAMGIRGANPEQQGRWRRGHSSQPQQAQRPWGRDKRPWGGTWGARASTNSSEMTRHLDLVQIFQKPNQQMSLRVSDALNLFFFFNSN